MLLRDKPRPAGSRQGTRRTLPGEQEARSLTFVPFPESLPLVSAFSEMDCGKLQESHLFAGRALAYGRPGASAVQNPRGAEITPFLVEGEAQTSRGLPESQCANN